MRWLINNWPFKIFSFILSIILWMYVAGELERGLWWKPREIKFRNIPVKILGAVENEFQVSMVPDKADVSLYNYKGDITGIKQDDITLFVDLGNLKAGSYELYIQSIVPKDFSVNKIEPSVVKVTIKERPVEPVPPPPVPQTEETPQE